MLRPARVVAGIATINTGVLLVAAKISSVGPDLALIGAQCRGIPVPFVGGEIAPIGA